MSVVIRVVRCQCGKFHLCAGIGPISQCACGLPLWLRMWEAGR